MRSPTALSPLFFALSLSFLALGCGDDADGMADAGGSGDPDSGPAEEPFETPEPAGCISDVSAGHHSFTCGELTFEVTVPAQCLDEACGVILDVHGWFMDGMMEAMETELDRKGEENGYLAIHPTATLQPGMLSDKPEHSWRAGIDDVPLHDFLVDFIDVFNADEDRIHITGFSQGGAMTWRLIAKYPGLFASAAPAAAATGNLGGGTGAVVGSTPDKALPLLFLHGTNDALSPFTVAKSQRDTYVAGWGLPNEEEVMSGEGFVWTRYSNDDGLVFEFLQHDYESVLAFLKGHCFPGSTTAGILACKQENPPFHWGTLVMQFFKDHPKGQ